jgi:fucose permease
MKKGILTGFGDYVVRFLLFVAATVTFSIAWSLIAISFPIALGANLFTSGSLTRAWTDTIEVYGMRSGRP